MKTPLPDRPFGPANVAVQASDLAVIELGINTLEESLFSTIYDVIAIERKDGDIVFTTCRTIERPGRGEYHVPERYIEAIHNIPEGTYRAASR